jgi:hypothetical protein
LSPASKAISKQLHTFGLAVAFQLDLGHMISPLLEPSALSFEPLFLFLHSLDFFLMLLQKFLLIGCHVIILALKSFVLFLHLGQIKVLMSFFDILHKTILKQASGLPF